MIRRRWIAQPLVLALLYWLTGLAILALQRQMQVVTPLLFVPEGIALAAALRWGRISWPGILIGQTLLALSQQIPLAASLAIGLCNASLDVGGAAWLRRFSVTYPFPGIAAFGRHLLVVSLVLQPISAAAGVFSLAASLPQSGATPAGSDLLVQFASWWCGNSAAQLLLTPCLLDLAGLRDSLRRPARLLPLLIGLGCYALALSGAQRLLDLSRAWAVPLLLLPIMLVASVLIANGTVVSLFGLGIELQLAVQQWLFQTPFRDGLLLALAMLLGVIVCQAIAILLAENQSSLVALRAQTSELDRQLRVARVAASLTHQIKQPLALLREHFESNGEAAISPLHLEPSVWVSSMAECSDHVSQLLEVIKTQPQDGDLRQALHWSLLRFRGLPNPGGIRLSVQQPQDQDLRVSCNNALLAIVLDNLRTNAFEACAPGVGLVEISLRRRRDGRILLQVADNGPGLPFADAAAKPTDLFTTKPDGSGLGLFLVQTIADICNAELVYGRSHLGGALVALAFRPAAERLG